MKGGRMLHAGVLHPTKSGQTTIVALATKSPTFFRSDKSLAAPIISPELTELLPHPEHCRCLLKLGYL